MTTSNYFLDNLLLFIQLLRRAGIPVSSEQAMDVVRALTLVDVGNREQVYYAARSVLVSRYEHLRLFTALFNRFLRNHHLANGAGKAHAAPLAPRHDRRHHVPLLISYMARKARADDPEIDALDKSGTYSASEILQRKDFSAMTDEELDAIKRLIQALRWQLSLRQTRRYVPDKRGRRLHMRRVLASAAKRGGVPLQLAWRTRKIKPRPLVLLADISGSMEKLSRLVLQFAYGVAHSLPDVECFVFGTRLTRITPALKLKNIDRALDEAARDIEDWSGGTRIGASLQAFNRHYSRRVLHRGAIVLIVSDGWERGDIPLLQREMHYLQLRCHRLIWLNPLLGKNTYQPLVEGMRAALAYVDDFLPVHNLQSLTALAEHLQKLDKRRNPGIALTVR
jgi:uncharacterized protein